GWNISGINNGAVSDAEHTGKALMALIAGGAVADDPAVRAGVQYLAQTESPNGSWTNVSVSGNPVTTTAYALLGLTSTGIDTTSGAWKQQAVSTSPDAFLIASQQPDGSIPGSFDQTSSTSQAAQALLRNWLPIAAPGYQVVRANGHLTGLGGAPSSSATFDGTVGAWATNSGHGTWLGLANGGVITEGDAGFYGSMGGTKLNRPMVGIAATPTGRGYWMVAGDGGIFTFGDAQYFGGLGAIKLDQPIVAMASTPTGRGYTLFASDGGVFAFGDAKFLGSMGGIKLNKPVVGGTSATNGSGYWMVASDGGIFNFGTAPFAGSLGALKLDKPIAGMQHTGDGRGYWLVGADGGVFTFGGAPFLGAALGDSSPVVAFAS
ncbi:MAG: Esterase, partial [Actinomycetia bacterium]|nr:Esterase [Actinomycetes bacterium]